MPDRPLCETQEKSYLIKILKSGDLHEKVRKIIMTVVNFEKKDEKLHFVFNVRYHKYNPMQY